MTTLAREVSVTKCHTEAQASDREKLALLNREFLKVMEDK